MEAYKTKPLEINEQYYSLARITASKKSRKHNRSVIESNYDLISKIDSFDLNTNHYIFEESEGLENIILRNSKKGFSEKSLSDYNAIPLRAVIGRTISNAESRQWNFVTSGPAEPWGNTSVYSWKTDSYNDFLRSFRNHKKKFSEKTSFEGSPEQDFSEAIMNVLLRTGKITKNYQVYLDAPVGIGLTFKNRPCAITSFAAFDKSTVRIYQVQGVRPYKNYYSLSSSRGIFNIEWDKILIELAENYARNLGFSHLSIQGQELHDYSIMIRSGKDHYDNLAKKLGFKENQNNWYKKI